MTHWHSLQRLKCPFEAVQRSLGSSPSRGAGHAFRWSRNSVPSFELVRLLSLFEEYLEELAESVQVAVLPTIEPYDKRFLVSVIQSRNLLPPPGIDPFVFAPLALTLVPTLVFPAVASALGAAVGAAPDAVSGGSLPACEGKGDRGCHP